ncbi:hypothetical protein GTU79_19390 [Sodalis ligni]|uniref:HumD family translesion DNA polymerase n=1 Tax=Sodalis ligni TaxID=2697027 RepID=UPI00193F1DA2|nr:S24 family peptidase [Sodalis ligni]QWA09507.1 hypothetical protein GTU79_19390 [Sodalis ligni]
MGFPSPAKDYEEKSLSLDELCIARPAATYFMRAKEGSYRAGIYQGAILVVDRSLTPVDGTIVVVELTGELAVRRFKIYPERGLEKLDAPGVLLPMPEPDDEGLQCWGVVTYVINDMMREEFDDCPGM